MSDGIRLEDGETKGRYVYVADGGPEAYLTFSKAGETRIIIDHTEVPDFYRGKSVELKLVEQAVADARRDGKTIFYSLSDSRTEQVIGLLYSLFCGRQDPGV